MFFFFFGGGFQVAGFRLWQVVEGFGVRNSRLRVIQVSGPWGFRSRRKGCRVAFWMSWGPNGGAFRFSVILLGNMMRTKSTLSFIRNP